MPMDTESRMINWMEKGVYDALQKKYLKTLLFCVCETTEGPMIEEYVFSFNYSNWENQEVSMNVNHIGNKTQGGTFKCNLSTQITPNQMRSSAWEMVRTLIQFMKTLLKMPEETILMKLLYYDDVTPANYEPPFFRGCTEQVNNPWTKNPLKLEVGNVNSKHLVLTPKVKSNIDPCEDENDDMQNDDVSLGADSVEGDASDSETKTINESQYVVALVDKERVQKNQSTVDGGTRHSTENSATQDPIEDEEQFRRIKEWISSYHLGAVELTDVLSNFSDISVVLIEVMDKLVKEDTLTKSGTNTYIINKLKENGDADCALSCDFLELDDLADPQSPFSSSFNSGFPTLASEEWFDSDMLSSEIRDSALRGDFLELDDLADPQSPFSSSFNSSCPTSA